MVCDIHCFIEYERKGVENKYGWCPFGREVDPGRDYAVFEALAGVRGKVTKAMFKPRGIPSNLGYVARDANRLYMVDRPTDNENEVERSKALDWVKSGQSVIEEAHWVTHPDWHTHSWLFLEEFKRVIFALKAEGDCWLLKYEAMIGAMEVLADGGQNDVRVVFWFDN